MPNKNTNNKKSFFKISLIAAFISSLCCFTPIVFVLLGLATASTAAYWGNYFFFGFWWLFVAIGLFLIAIMLIVYWRKNQVCTLDAVKRNRRKIMNSILLSLILFIFLYLAIEVLWENIWIKMGLTTWKGFSALFQTKQENNKNETIIVFASYSFSDFFINHTCICRAIN